MICGIISSREYDAENLSDAHRLLRHLCPGEYTYNIDRDHGCWKFYEAKTKKLKARYDIEYKSLNVFERI